MKEFNIENKRLCIYFNKTNELKRMYKEKGINTIYEVNPGNHFTDGSMRMAKGIKWILGENYG